MFPQVLGAVYRVHGEHCYERPETVSGQPYSPADKCPCLPSIRNPGVNDDDGKDHNDHDDDNKDHNKKGQDKHDNDAAAAEDNYDDHIDDADGNDVNNSKKNMSV